MLEPGVTLNDRYTLTQLLRENATRQTWLAADLETGDRVIVKLLATGTVRWEDVKLFEREAKTLQQLNHEAIPRYRSYFEVDHQSYWFALVQDYIPGLSLQDALDQGKRFTPEQIRQIAEQVLRILQTLHQLDPPILHRDIKPSNLLWAEDDRLYLIDFGSVQSQGTQAGTSFTVVGTYGYTPIEQFGGQAVPSSDLYALGMTLIHLLTRIPPTELPQRDLRVQFRDRLSPTVDPSFIRWLEQMTEPALERRLSSATAALHALQGSQASKTPFTPPTRPSRQTPIRLQKSPQQLLIEIPSRFELQILFPLKHRLSQLSRMVKQELVGAVQRGQKFVRHQPQHSAKSLTIKSAVLILLGALVVGALLPIVFHVIALLVSVAVTVLFFAFPAALFLLIILSGSAIDYFERLRICFEPEQFEIVRYSLRRHLLEKGDTARIEQVLTTLQQDFSGKTYPTLVITQRGDRKLLFIPLGAKRFVFGHQLNDTELQWLAQEIRSWLAELEQVSLTVD